MKTCNKCNTEKPVEEFNKKRNGYQPFCKLCDRAASKARYHKDRESHKLRVRERNLRVIQESKDYVMNLLLKSKCVDCGNSDPRVLEFDHVRGTKEYNVSNLIGAAHPIQRIIDEIAKCEIRCANCHRIVTIERSGSWRSKFESAML